MAQFIYKLLFITFVIAASGSSACPVSCNCTTTSDQGSSVDCQGKGLSTIPSELPEKTTTVDLRDNPIKCDCEFYHHWKILKGKGVVILGKCVDSDNQTGPSFKDLNNAYFNCDGSSVSRVSSQQPAILTNIKSTQALGNVESTQALGNVKSTQALGNVESTQALANVESTQALANVESTQALINVKSTQALANVESTQALGNVESTQALANMESMVVANVESTSVALHVESTSVEDNMKSTPVLADVLPSHITSVSSLPLVSKHVGDGTVKSSIGEHIPGLDRLTPSPSSSSLKPVFMTTTPKIPLFSTSVVLGSATTSSIQINRKASPPSQPTGFKPNVTSASPAVTILNASVTVTAPPTMHGPPIIVKFEEQITVGLNEVVQVKCTATGNPTPKVRMTVNTQPAEDVDGVTVTSHVSETEIELTVVRDSEVYCEATNELGRQKRKMKISVQQTGANYMILKVKLPNEEFDENMENKDSIEFQDMAKRIISQVLSVVGSLPGFLAATVLKLQPGSVKADILIKTFQDTDDSVEKKLKAEVENAKLGNLAVDRYLHTIEQSRACPSVFENVTWNDVVYGDVDVQPCPRGAKGFAKRNCSLTGNWYYPDYTNCKSDDFDSLRNKIKQYTTGIINKDDTEKNLLTSLQNLTNLSIPKEDYAMMAGDVVTSAEILEIVVDYIKRENQDGAHSETEIKHVINVANNVLHWNNEQELIVAQKMIQTASRFIRALETYGLQAARVASFGGDRNLAIFTSENIVMGAGKADPESITKDVIFPNYNWRELGQVREEWNATTFVVLSKEMIKPMNAGKDGIRIAGFLYRTLTRILSMESASGSEKGRAFEVNSAVISASMDPKPTYKLTDPVIIASSNLEEVDLEGDEPICAFWDFSMNAPHGGWSKEGCNTSSYNRMQTTCQCDHMTNFAVLRKKPIPPIVDRVGSPISDFIHCIYIACWIIIAFAGITFLILLVLSPWLKPDRTWAMHMCVCISIIIAFVLILLGLASYNDLEMCNLFSFLVHYFFLCAFSWILTESVYMNTWDTNNGPKKKYWLGYFLLGWGLPGISMLITWFINKLAGFESYMSCWMSFFNPLIWVFFIPALVFFVVSCILFVRVWRSITGSPRPRLKGYYRKTRFRVHIRYCLILMLMFIITWLVGILLITYYWKALLCILFIICCIITGFMILLFYVIMDRQVRDAFKQCCCYCKRGRRGSYWVRGDDLWTQKPPPEQLEYQQQEEERLVTDAAEEQPDQDSIELNGRDKTHGFEEPLLRPDSRDSSTESFDPLYERVKQSVTVDVQQVPSKQEEEPKAEPIYAKVIKPKPPRHPESDSDDDDLTPEEREARGIRGLTREQVIRMAKKSDASKRVLKTYESPSGSREILGPNRPVYLLNQKELDEELRQFRTFFSNSKSPSTSTPRTEEGTSTNVETTSSFEKRETSTRTEYSSFSPEKEQSTFMHSSYEREESTSSSITKRTFSPESQRSVGRTEGAAFQQTPVGARLLLEETAIDSSLEELDRRSDEENKGDKENGNKPTAV